MRRFGNDMLGRRDIYPKVMVDVRRRFGRWPKALRSDDLFDTITHP